jgi:membrane protease YdiL (CAAX protease family)
MRIVAPGPETTTALLFACVYVVMSGATGLAQRAWPAPVFGATYLTSDAWYIFGYKIGLLLVAPLLWLRQSGYRLADFLPGWRLNARTAASLIVAFAAGVLLNAGLFDAVRGAAARFGLAEYGFRVGLGALLVLFGAGIPEEVVYRGVLQTRLERRWGRVTAILATSVLFTAWHLPSRYLLASGAEGAAGDFASVVLGTGVPVLIVGLLFGVAWDRWRNLPVLIALHWGIDVLPSVSSLLQIPPGAAH